MPLTERRSHSHSYFPGKIKLIYGLSLKIKECGDILIIITPKVLKVQEIAGKKNMEIILNFIATKPPVSPNLTYLKKKKTC